MLGSKFLIACAIVLVVAIVICLSFVEPEKTCDETYKENLESCKGLVEFEQSICKSLGGEEDAGSND